MKTRQLKITTVLLITLLTLTACTDKDLQKVSVALRDTAQGLAVLQTAVINANAQKLLSDEQTRIILIQVNRVNLAGVEAVKITRGINSLSSTDRSNILAILNPVIQSFQDMQLGLISGIKDSQTLTNIQTLTASLQATLNVVQTTLAVKGN